MEKGKGKDVGTNTIVAATAAAGGVPAWVVGAAVRPDRSSAPPSQTTQMEQGVQNAIHERELANEKKKPGVTVVPHPTR
jgi:hypothetical protein